MTERKKLVLIGSGIKTLSHLTEEAKTYIQHADVVLYLVNEPILEQYLQKQNANTISLEPCYFQYQNRSNAYEKIAELILSQTVVNQFVAVVLYGHPTVFSIPGLMAIKQAKQDGLETLIIPGISAEDCLFADLGIDPGNPGHLSIEATEFLLKKRNIDVNSHVIIWQIAMLGSLTHNPCKNVSEILVLFREKLLSFYEPEHNVTLYEASIYPGITPKIITFLLKDIVISTFPD